MITKQKIARIISDLFIPPTFTLIGFSYIAFNLFQNFFYQFAVILIAVLFGLILPISFFVYYRKRKIVADNDAVIKEQRLYPFFTSIILSLLGALFSYLFTGSNLPFLLWVIISINTTGLLLINHFWKISAHAIGGSTIIGLFYFLDSALFPYFVLIIIAIGWSRYILKVHTAGQIIAGTLYGFFLTLLQLKFYSGGF